MIHRFPASFGLTAVWDETNSELELGSANCSVADARAYSQLSNVSSSNAELAVAKSLLRTHDRLYELEFPEERKRLHRKKLTAVQRNVVHKKYRVVGIVDFLWRLRCRSNYESPEAYIHATNAPGDAVGFCETLTNLRN